jgi:hypothetical protein
MRILYSGSTEYLRSTRALLATVVLAVGADLLGTKICVAAVALAVHPLANCLVDQILTTSPARNGEAIRNVSLALLVTGCSLRSELLRALAFVLRLLDRVSGAPLAPLVATFKAGLIGSVRGVTLVARTMDSHANVLLDAWAGRSGGERQVSCFDFEAVFLEKSLGALRGAHHWRRGGWDFGRSVRFGLGGAAGRRPAKKHPSAKLLHPAKHPNSNILGSPSSRRTGHSRRSGGRFRESRHRLRGRCSGSRRLHRFSRSVAHDPLDRRREPSTNRRRFLSFSSHVDWLH